MDAKFTKRFENYKRSLASLTEARERDLSDSFVLSGISAKYCITFDLAWKVMKDILLQHYAITDFVVGSPREVLRTSFQANLIDNDAWIQMLKIRNELAHDYDGEVVAGYCQMIINEYVDLMTDFQNKINVLLNNLR